MMENIETPMKLHLNMNEALKMPAKKKKIRPHSSKITLQPKVDKRYEQNQLFSLNPEEQKMQLQLQAKKSRQEVEQEISNRLELLEYLKRQERDERTKLDSIRQQE